MDVSKLIENLTNPKFADTLTAIANYGRNMFDGFSKTGQMTIFNTDWMNQQNVKNNMLAMFSKNILKQWIFFGEVFLKVNLVPFMRKAIGLSSKQKILY